MIDIHPIFRMTVLIYFCVLISVLPGCTNIREVETITYTEEPIMQVNFISEEQVVKAVASTREVMMFRRLTATPCLIQVEHYPTVEDPVYLVGVAEDQHDHLVIYNHYKVDAYSGRIVNWD